MLQMTNTAATTLAKERAQLGLPDHYGVRIFPSDNLTNGGRPAYKFAFVEEPEGDDQVGEATGTRFFVAPEIADPLANAVLDAQETERGPALVLKPRRP
jgi:Fe-S cluster assembly iron-binding protein IscA